MFLVNNKNKELIVPGLLVRTVKMQLPVHLYSPLLLNKCQLTIIMLLGNLEFVNIFCILFLVQ